MENVKNKGGRPPKIAKFTAALEQILNTPHSVGYAIIYTDADLLEMTNDLLDKDDRICTTTFEKYKAGILKDDTLLNVFVGVYKKALRQQAANLFERLESEGAGVWQKYAWIIERKFAEWNLRTRVVDETPQPKELVFRVRQDGATD